jgi:hypothetical protein
MSASVNPLTYNAYVTQIATLAVYNVTTVSGVVTPVDAAFATIIPQMLEFAEMRIQRDLDLAQTMLAQQAYSVNTGSNSFTISTADFITVQNVQAQPSGGTQTYNLLPVTKEFIFYSFDNSSYVGFPVYYALTGGDLASYGANFSNIIIGPYADQTYNITVWGTMRMNSLTTYATTANANTLTTYLSYQYPDLLLMASMIYISGFQRNFGRAADDPAMAVSYEAMYQGLLKSALMEEYRKKGLASAYTSNTPSPVATPNR